MHNTTNSANIYINRLDVLSKLLHLLGDGNDSQSNGSYKRNILRHNPVDRSSSDLCLMTARE